MTLTWLKHYMRGLYQLSGLFVDHLSHRMQVEFSSIYKLKSNVVLYDLFEVYKWRRAAVRQYINQLWSVFQQAQETLDILG